MDAFSRDLRYSLRGLSRQPGFVIVAVLSLALGIGVNTAIFSVLDGLLWRPLALREPDRAVFVFHAGPSNPDRGTSFPAFEHYRARTDLFSKVMAVSGARPLVLVDGDRRDQVYAELVTSGFFSMSEVDVRPGRGFDPEADRLSGASFVTVLSHAFWQRRFGADPSIVGQAIVLNGRPFTVVGVGRPGFVAFDTEVSADMWIPIPAWADIVNERVRLTSEEHWLTTIAQLKPGVTLDQAHAAISAAGTTFGLPVGHEARVRPASERLAAMSTDLVAIGAAIFGVGLLVLTLSCTNITNLLIARAAARQREMAVRLALGSSKFHLIRLWLIESVVVCSGAAVVGLIFAWWLIDAVVAFKPPAMMGDPESPALAIGFRFDVRSLGFAFGISLLAATAVGLVAGRQSAKPGDRRFRPGLNLRSAVIALQMALSLILLIPCGLFIRSWLNSFDMAPGFTTDRVLLLPISTNQNGIRVEKPPGFDLDLPARVAALPGVEAATVMDPVPLWFADSAASYVIDGRPDERHRIRHTSITPGFFKTLQIPLLRGRDFTTADSPAAPPVAVVNETMARRFWPDGNAIGQRIRDGDDVIEIVGIARDAKYVTLADTSTLWLYRPLAQSPKDNLSLSLAVRTSGDPMQLATAVEREVKALLPSWPAFQFRTLDEGLRLQQLVPRMGAAFLGGLGTFGLVLAAIGMYGVMAYVVRQRTREIAIRLAIGAPIFKVVALVMRQGMTVCLAGAAVGLCVALVATQFLADVLYGVGAADPITYAAVLMFLLGVSALACYLPARQVGKVNPLDALRAE